MLGALSICSTEKAYSNLSFNYLVRHAQASRPCPKGFAHKLAKSDKVKENDKVVNNHSKTVLLPNMCLGTCLTE